MMSAHGTVTEVVSALKNGAFDYVTKPLPRDLPEVYLKWNVFSRVAICSAARRGCGKKSTICPASRFRIRTSWPVPRAAVVPGTVGLTGISGPYRDRVLPELPSRKTRWREWYRENPETKFLRFDRFGN